jgi:hypothetical protein
MYNKWYDDQGWHSTAIDELVLWNVLDEVLCFLFIVSIVE